MNAMGFLERMGSDCRLRYATRSELATALDGETIDPQFKSAIVRRDRGELERELGAMTNICAMVHAPDCDEPEEQTGN
jgi:hypothetical protein